jgi:hypothetical protein
MRRAVHGEAFALGAILVAQAFLFTRLLHSATNYDEDVYLAAVDALRHGQALGSDVFAAQFPGFYELLRGLSYLTGIGVISIRDGMVFVTLVGTVGAWLAGRRFGGPVGGLLAAGCLVVAPPLDLFGWQVIADTPALALTALALGLATLGAPVAAVAAGAALGAALSVKLTALTAAPAVLWLLRDRLAWALGGFAAVCAAVLLAHARALGSLWSSGVTYHDDARSTPAVIPHPHRQIFDQIPHRTPFFALALVAIALGIVFFARRQPLGVWPLWSWVALALAFLFVHKPLHYNHLVELPFTLAVASGATIGAALRRGPAVLTAVVATALLAGFVQQVHRVDEAKTPEPPVDVAAARALERLTPPDAITIDDRPIVSFLAHRRVDGPLVDLANLRWETGSLTDEAVIRRFDHVDAVVVSRALRERPRILQALPAAFERRYARGGVTIWVRRASR